MSRVKIVATIGPATANAEALRELAASGMALVRLNGSHGNLKWHEETIRLVRQTLPDMPILLDIPGRKIRTELLTHEPSFGVGDIVTLTTEPGHDGSAKCSVNNRFLHERLHAGAVVLADDGTLSFVVDRVEGRDIHLRATTAGTLRSRKGINVPYVDLGLELVTERDHEMMRFACDNEVDFVGISFVESAAHVEAIRALTRNGTPRIVAKIENRGGMENMREVIGAADVIMIDRGDLSVETNLQTVAVFQKYILRMANSLSKPVIIATEMLHSMIQSPLPTKAEISDITNAVLDGAALTMLSGETAVGQYATEAVKIMRGVINAAEDLQQSDLDGERPETASLKIQDAMESAAAMVCRTLPITKIVVVTKSGYAARVLSSHRPRQPILAVSNDRNTARALNVLPGTKGIHVKVEFSPKSSEHIAACLQHLWNQKEITASDVILVAAVSYPRAGNLLNLLQTHSVADLAEALGW